MDSSRTLRAADGAELAYRLRRADAPRGTIVLIHGLASNLTRWSEFVSTTRLAPTWNLLRVDLRGHGGSLYRGKVGMDVWCDDIAAILRAEGEPRAVLAGHCLGANLALWFARRVPEATAGLVLIEPMFRPALKSALARVARLRAVLVPAALGLRALAALGIHRRRLQTLDLAELDRAAREAMARAGGSFPEERYRSSWQDLKSLPLSIYVQDLLAVTAPLPDLDQIRAPALAMLSSGAALTDPDVTAAQLRALPRCEIERLAAQHWIPTEQPEAMRRLIESWCEALESP